jgi:hypothetical protein
MLTPADRMVSAAAGYKPSPDAATKSRPDRKD